MIEWLKHPWPWYVSGPLMGLMVPALLILGNKTFGISSSLRHICAACLPANISFFKYDWKKEIWNLFFAGGILIGGFIAFNFLHNPVTVQLNPKLISELQRYGINNYEGLVPSDLFSWQTLFFRKRFYHDSTWGFSCWFRNPVCWRLYIWPFHNGVIKFTMAITGSDNQFYGRRLYCSQSNYAIHS